jgi:hypothetical protein
VRAALKSLVFVPEPNTLPADPAAFSFQAEMGCGPTDGEGEEFRSDRLHGGVAGSRVRSAAADSRTPPHCSRRRMGAATGSSALPAAREGQPSTLAVAEFASVTQVAIWVREVKPSLTMTLRTWFSTVRSEMNSRLPICLLLSPCAIRRATSVSRLASGASRPLSFGCSCWLDDPRARVRAFDLLIAAPALNSAS